MRTRNTLIIVLMLNLVIAVSPWGSGNVAAAPPQATQTLTAWGRVKMTCGGTTLPFGVYDGVTLKLVSSNSKVKYSQTIASGSNSVANAFKSGVFQFANVPTGITLQFTLTYAGPVRTVSMSSAFQFNYPTGLQGVLRQAERVRIAGYMGDYVLDCAGKITPVQGKP